MAAELENALGASLEACTLIAGSGGIFDLRCDGSLIYQKSQTGRFPSAQEILELLERRS